MKTDMENAIGLIASHLDRGMLKYKIHDVDTICAFTGITIRESVSINDLLSDVFTDWQYVNPPYWLPQNQAFCHVGDF